MSNEYSSVLAPYISALVAAKRAVGYTYETTEFYLHDFESYCSLHAKCKSLSRDLVLEWAISWPATTSSFMRRCLQDILSYLYFFNCFTVVA